MTSRREFLGRGAMAAAGLSLPRGAGTTTGHEAAAVGAARHAQPFIDLHRAPDAVGVQTATGYQRLQPSGERWQGAGVTVSFRELPDALRLVVAAPSTAVQRVHLRWRGALDAVQLLLGDAWERGYGDLEWRKFAPDRVMPWYVAMWDGERTHAYGVRAGAAAFCFWRVDRGGISLWADVRSGGVGVELGERALAACDVVSHEGNAGEIPFTAIRALCRHMCPTPRGPTQPVYGSNDWYWAYGHNSAESVVTDAQHTVDLAPPDDNRPFVVIDDGWQPERGDGGGPVGRWDRGNARFPDLPGLTAEIRRIGARPGIWIRPLLAPADAPDAWRLPRDRRYLDPTVPGALEKVAADIRRLHEWGFELIKHDYSTYDVLGRWGARMGATLTADGWTFASGPTHTTAEVIDGLYRTIRTAAGDALVLGCNTVSHLSAGRFELCRIGDDTSGREWSRTPKYGVNALGFRAVQHDAFYAADPDCVGVTTAVPWAQNRQWLDLVARSGCPLFASLAPDALGDVERRDLRAAYARAARSQPLGEPIDWQETTWPSHWRFADGERSYDWIGPDGITAVE